MFKQNTPHHPKATSAGSVQARIAQQLVDEAMRALRTLTPVHLLLIALGGHWAVWMTSAAEPRFVIQFAVGNEVHPHEADVDEPDFIGYLKAPQTSVALTLLEQLRPLGSIASPFGRADVSWTLLDAFDGVMDIADEILRSHEEMVTTLTKQMIDDLPRTMRGSVDMVLSHALIHAPPYAITTCYGGLH